MFWGLTRTRFAKIDRILLIIIFVFKLNQCIFFSRNLVDNFYWQSNLIHAQSELSTKGCFIWASTNCIMNPAVVLPLYESQSFGPLIAIVVSLPARQHFPHFLVGALDQALALWVTWPSADEFGAGPYFKNGIYDLIHKFLSIVTLEHNWCATLAKNIDQFVGHFFGSFALQCPECHQLYYVILVSHDPAKRVVLLTLHIDQIDLCSWVHVVWNEGLNNYWFATMTLLQLATFT